MESGRAMLTVRVAPRNALTPAPSRNHLNCLFLIKCFIRGRHLLHVTSVSNGEIAGDRPGEDVTLMHRYTRGEEQGC